jgi:hypothetical protein
MRVGFVRRILNESEPFSDVDAEVRLILKRILKKENEKVWAGLFWLSIGNSGTNKERLCIYNEQTEEVEHFCCLGSQVTKNGGTEEDADSRIKKARGAFAQLTSIWKSNVLSCKTNLRIFETNVKPVLLY